MSKYGNLYTGFMLRTDVQRQLGGLPRVPSRRRCSTSTTPTTRAKGYGFQIELAYRVARWGGKIVEVPITFTDRVRGYSKMSMAVMVEEMALVSWWGIRDRLRKVRNRSRTPV